MRVADGEPGDELQVDFGRLGPLFDAETGRRRVCWALIFTPVVSRYSFVWLIFRQTITDVIGEFEAAWAFYDGGAGVVGGVARPRRAVSKLTGSGRASSGSNPSFA